MIYIVVGNDNKKKNIYIKSLINNRDFISLNENNISKESLYYYAISNSLFGESFIIIVENIITKNEILLKDKDLKDLQDSPTIFIFIEDKLLASNEKKYKKYSSIEYFEEKKTINKPKINTFAIADAYGAHDKIKTWILYREVIDAGTEPEPISGIIFWKIKTMLLNGNKLFPENILKKQSSELVSLYHRAHRGDCDFVIGLEQFILSSLTK